MNFVCIFLSGPSEAPVPALEKQGVIRAYMSFFWMLRISVIVPSLTAYFDFIFNLLGLEAKVAEMCNT